MSRKKSTPEAVEDAVVQKLGLQVTDVELPPTGFSSWVILSTEAQREWLLLRRNYCLAKIPPSALPEKLDISEVAKAADIALKRMKNRKSKLKI